MGRKASWQYLKCKYTIAQSTVYLRKVEVEKACRTRGCYGTHSFWQISQPYLNQGRKGADYAHHITTAPLLDFQTFLGSCNKNMCVGGPFRV